MKPVAKVALVVGGYLLAGLLASAVVAVHVAATSGADRNGASGMYAFGDGLYFLAVFGLASILPTGAAAYFLRPYRRFWQILSVVAVVLAATAVLAAIAYFGGRGADRVSTLGMLAAYAVLRILLAPLFSLVFLLSGLFAPERTFKLRLLGAGLVEGAVFLAVAVVWAVGR